MIAVRSCLLVAVFLVTSCGDDGSARPEIGADLLERQHEVQAVVSHDGTLVAAWTDDIALTGLQGWRCRFSASEDEGDTWTKPVTYRRDGYELSGNPAVTVDPAGTIHALCMSVDEDYAKGSLDLSTSSDGGRTWSPWRNVVTRVDGIPDRPKMIASADGTLHVVFTDVVQTGDELVPLKGSIHYLRSVDGGASWAPEQVMSGEREGPIAFIDGFQGASIQQARTGEIVVPWADYYGATFHVAVSDRQGGPFSPPVDLPLAVDAFAFAVPCTETAIDSSGRNLVVTIHEGHAISRTHLLLSADGGQQWERGTSPSANGTNFAIAYDSTDRLHALWLERDGDTMDTRYATSTDHGRTFSTPTSLAGGGYPHEISENDDAEFTFSLGSYQSLVIGPDDQVNAFWLDYAAGSTRPRLMFTSLQ